MRSTVLDLQHLVRKDRKELAARTGSRQALSCHLPVLKDLAGVWVVWPNWLGGLWVWQARVPPSEPWQGEELVKDVRGNLISFPLCSPGRH